MGLGFGLGIGAQGQLKDYTSLYADAYKQKAALAAAGKAKKDAQDSAQMSKLLKSVWVDGSKYHRVLVPEAEKVYVDASEKLNELQAEYPNDWVARAQPELAKASSQLGVLRNQTEQYRKVEALPNTADPVQKKTREALGWANNKQSLLAAIGSDVSGSVTATPDGNIVFNKQYYDPKDDMRDNVAKTLSQKQFELDQKYNQVTKGAFTQTNSIKRVAKNAAQAQLIADELNKTFKLNITADEIPNVEDVAGAYYDSNPDAEKQMDFFHQNDYYDYNTNKEKMTPDERAQSKRDNFITGVQSKLGANLNTTYVKNSASKSGSDGATAVKVDDLKANGKSNEIRILNYKGLEKSVTPYLSIPSLPVKTQVSAGEGLRDDKGGALPAGQYDITTGTPSAVRVWAKSNFVEGIVKGAMIPDDATNLNPSDYEWRLIVPSTYETAGGSKKTVHVDYNKLNSALLDAKTDKADKAQYKAYIEAAEKEVAYLNANKGGAVSKEDQDALDWLKANPNAKQAAGIRAKLKAKGIL